MSLNYVFNSYLECSLYNDDIYFPPKFALINHQSNYPVHRAHSYK